MIEIAVVVIVVTVLLIASKHFGGVAVLTGLVLVTLAAWPKALHELGGSGVLAPYVGIGGSSVTLYSYSFVLVSSLMLLIARWGLRPQYLLWLPLALWVTVGFSTSWASSDALLAGVAQLLTGAIAWCVGLYAGRNAQLSPRFRRRVLLIIVSLIMLQLLVVALQWAGFDVNSMTAANQAQLPGRFNGTLAHPNDLGKVVVLLILIALPLLSDTNGIRTSRALPILFIAGAITLLATGGRAVTIAAGTMILFWVLIQPGTKIGRSRKAVAVLFSVGFLGVVALALWGRFEEDPVGGARSGLTDLALGQISLRPLWGVGPNMYVEVVGQFDSLTATGVPVHNAFLLATAELGIVGAVCLSLPFVAVIFAALTQLGSRSRSGAWSRSIVAALPAVLLMGLTGWGLLGSYVFPLFSFAFGWAFGGLREPARSPTFGQGGEKKLARTMGPPR